MDFITPVSDDPYTWGQIAAANSLSDVFAMGGKPFVALNVVGFPTKALGLDVLKEVLRGGQEKVSEAGAFLLGGHSVDDREPKYGLVVYGEVRRDSIWKVTGARPGDLLILTKPVGTGIVATAVKADMVEDEASRTEAARWMTTLNDLPRRISQEECRMVRACTDVTGFGLAGHATDMLSAGGTDLTLGIRECPPSSRRAGSRVQRPHPGRDLQQQDRLRGQGEGPGKTRRDPYGHDLRRPDIGRAPARNGQGRCGKDASGDPRFRL